MNGMDRDSQVVANVTGRMVHDLMNHLTIALGHSDLLAIELDEQDPAHAGILEIRQACRDAIALVKGWPDPLA